MTLSLFFLENNAKNCIKIETYRNLEGKIGDIIGDVGKIDELPTANLL